MNRTRPRRDLAERAIDSGVLPVFTGAAWLSVVVLLVKLTIERL